MEIRNIKLLVQDTGKFQIPDEKWRARDSPGEHCRAGSFVNSSLDCVGQEESPAHNQPQGNWSPSLTRYKAAIHPRIPSFLCTSADRGARAFHSLTSNSNITYLAHKNWTNVLTYMKQISSEYTKRVGINKTQLVSRLGIFINNTQKSQTAEDSALQATLSVQFVARTQCSAGTCHPQTFLCNWGWPEQSKQIPLFGASEQSPAGMGRMGASFPGKYEEAGNRITSHPGKEFILDYRTKRLQWCEQY